MKRYWIAVLVAGVLTAGAAAQGTGASGASASGNASASTKASGNAGANGANASSSLSSGTNLQAELTKSLDAKKAKPGDEVTAKVTQDVKSNGQVVIHKGSKLVGHITEAQARSKENSESKLGIVFDKAVIKGGSEVALNAVVQALAPGERATAPNLSDDTGRMATPAPMGGGAPMGGMGEVTGAATSTVNSTLGGVNNTVGQVAGSTTG